MKKLFSFCIICLFCALPFSLSLAAEKSDIIILHTNDVHTSIDKGVSYAGVAAYKKRMQEKYGKNNVLLVDAGDAIQGGPVGSLTQGDAIITLMNAVDYDYMTLGNHEFDYGIPRLTELLAKLKAKVISCNITHIKDQSNAYTPYVITEIQGIKIAFVGITTPESLSKSTPIYFQDAEGNYILSFAEGGKGMDLYAAVQKNVDAVRKQGADIVIALAHLGIDEESAPWNTPFVVANTTGIDAFIDGHSHSLLENTFYKNKAGKEVIVTQTGTRLQSLGQLTLDPKSKKLTATIIKKIPEKDATVQGLIADINGDLEKILEQPVGSTTVALTTKNAQGQDVIREEETNLANLITDAFRTALNTDIALLNGGAIRASIMQGPITFRQIINVLPFGGDAVSIEVTGQMLLDALEMGAQALPEPNGGFLHVSGMEYSIDLNIPSSIILDDKANFVRVSGPYRVKNVRIKGKPLDLKKKYTVAGTDFILRQAGDGMTMFKNAKLLKDKFMIDNEILISFISKTLNGVVSTQYEKAQGRIQEIKKP